MPIQLPAAFAAVKGFLLSKKFLIPAAIIALFLAIGAGTYSYLNKQVVEKVEAAVEQADNRATIQTLETASEVQNATVTIDVKMDQLRNQTIRDYQYVQNRIESAPVETREAPVAPLIIDTLNELDRLRQARGEDRVPDAELPSG